MERFLLYFIYFGIFCLVSLLIYLRYYFLFNKKYKKEVVKQVEPKQVEVEQTEIKKKKQESIKLGFNL